MMCRVCARDTHHCTSYDIDTTSILCARRSYNVCVDVVGFNNIYPNNRHMGCCYCFWMIQCFEISLRILYITHFIISYPHPRDTPSQIATQNTTAPTHNLRVQFAGNVCCCARAPEQYVLHSYRFCPATFNKHNYICVEP